jgi:RNA polymerase sigma-70 factor (ECF subfamily)
VRSEDPTLEEREVARRYIEALERRHFAALAALVRADARFSFPPRAVWYDGLDAFRRASDKHAAPGEHRFVPAAANLQPAFAIYLRAPGERRYRPLALAVLRVEQRRVIEVVHWDRPELFEAFGLPMSFPPSVGFNQDELNAKEVR